ncbi:MAG: hypothetical protein PQJ44_02975 [Sphaerochaetaceae bacterium]|nr:hypothetical protein [Sphaerochaetaceae bacterium]
MKKYFCSILLLGLLFLIACSTPESVVVYQQNEDISTSLEYVSQETDDNTIVIDFILKCPNTETNFLDLLNIDIISVESNSFGYEYGKSSSSGGILTLGSNYNIYINEVIVMDIDNLELVEGESYNVRYEFTFLDLDSNISFQYAYFFSEGYHFGVS